MTPKKEDITEQNCEELYEKARQKYITSECTDTVKEVAVKKLHEDDSDYNRDIPSCMPVSYYVPMVVNGQLTYQPYYCYMPTGP